MEKGYRRRGKYEEEPVRRVLDPEHALSSPETEAAVIGVLMLEPGFRGEVSQKYPGAFVNFFSTQDSQDLLRAVLGTAGQALPAGLDPVVPHLRGTKWNPGHVLDRSGIDDREKFWEYVENLRQLAKRRRLKGVLDSRASSILDTPNIDVFTREVSEELSRLTIDSVGAHDPTMKAVAEKFKLAKKEGALGSFIPFGIPVLDRYLGGGLRQNPGELVAFVGFPKMRKTSLALNAIANWHLTGQDGATVHVCNEESVDDIDLLCTLWAQEATRLALMNGLTKQFKDESGITVRKYLTFSRDDVMSRKYEEPEYNKVLQDAYRIVTSWNIRFYTSALNAGNSGDFDAIMAQVTADVEHRQAKRILWDNLQGHQRSGEDDYENMLRVVPGVSSFVKNYKVLVIAISQLSREGKIRGSGGLEGRLNLGLNCFYDEKADSDMNGMKKLKVTKNYGRTRGWFEVELDIEPKSGLITDGWWKPV